MNEKKNFVLKVNGQRMDTSNVAVQFQKHGTGKRTIVDQTNPLFERAAQHIKTMM